VGSSGRLPRGHYVRDGCRVKTYQALLSPGRLPAGLKPQVGPGLPTGETHREVIDRRIFETSVKLGPVARSLNSEGTSGRRLAADAARRKPKAHQRALTKVKSQAGREDCRQITCVSFL